MKQQQSDSGQKTTPGKKVLLVLGVFFVVVAVFVGSFAFSFQMMIGAASNAEDSALMQENQRLREENQRMQDQITVLETELDIYKSRATASSSASRATSSAPSSRGTSGTSSAGSSSGSSSGSNSSGRSQSLDDD